MSVSAFHRAFVRNPQKSRFNKNYDYVPFPSLRELDRQHLVVRLLAASIQDLSP
jgi:hypothetical protein